MRFTSANFSTSRDTGSLMLPFEVLAQSGYRQWDTYRLRHGWVPVLQSGELPVSLPSFYHETEACPSPRRLDFCALRTLTLNEAGSCG